MAPGAASHGLGKPVLQEPELRQAIVAALVLSQPRRERRLIDSRDLAHERVQRHRLEGAALKSRAPLA